MSDESWPPRDACLAHGEPGCLDTPDEKWTMRFDEIGEAPILWCSHCGPKAHELQAKLRSAMAEHGPEFADDVVAEIEAAKGKAN